jgi:hypothetical protein
MKANLAQRRPFLNPVIFNSLWMVSLTMLFLFLVHCSTLQTAQADEGGHSHFRFGHITWEQVGSAGSNTAQITFMAGFRRSGFECWDPLLETVVACSESDKLPRRAVGS